MALRYVATSVLTMCVAVSLSAQQAQPAEVFTQLLDAGWREANPLVAAPTGEVCTDGSC